MDHGGDVLRKAFATKSTVVGQDERVAAPDPRIEQTQLVQLVIVDPKLLRQVENPLQNVTLRARKRLSMDFVSSAYGIGLLNGMFRAGRAELSETSDPIKHLIP
jgi:hypothetical protein